MQESFIFEHFDTIFMIFFVMFGIVFAIVIGRILAESIRNHRSPRLSVEATVVTKRMQLSSTGMNQNHHASTWYYATFEVESGDRMELAVGAQNYGLLVEGDHGKLTFQGTRYLGFERN